MDRTIEPQPGDVVVYPIVGSRSWGIAYWSGAQVARFKVASVVFSTSMGFTRVEHAGLCFVFPGGKVFVIEGDIALIK